MDTPIIRPSLPYKKSRNRSDRNPHASTIYTWLLYYTACGLLLAGRCIQFLESILKGQQQSLLTVSNNIHRRIQRLDSSLFYTWERSSPTLLHLQNVGAYLHSQRKWIKTNRNAKYPTPIRRRIYIYNP
jgi:hypothetical protein